MTSLGEYLKQQDCACRISLVCNCSKCSVTCTSKAQLHSSCRKKLSSIQVGTPLAMHGPDTKGKQQMLIGWPLACPLLHR